tara:strand:- start:218 stop:643 length:426 start_codon:yes stop_codon:yes gene_type:complete
MILFDLDCENKHQFEAWFPSSAKYSDQRKKKLINCPYCNSNNVKKALMAPNLNVVSKIKDRKIPTLKNRKSLETNIKKLKKLIEKNTEDVGKNFAEEARKMHYGEKATKSIRGETTKKEVKELIEEGISCVSMPWFPREDA